MANENKTWFIKGLRDGIPISLGYLAAFTLGIAAKNAGFTAFQAALASLTNNASAGQFAGFTLAAAGAGYLELAVMEFIVNARYLLMSCALSQKLSPKTSVLHRLFVSAGVTDEIFGVSMSAPGRLNPFYTMGLLAVASPGWASGTYLGERNVYLYILVMAAVTYAIRMLPLVLIRREITNRFIRSFLYYVPYVTLAVMTFPAILSETGSVWSAWAALLTGALLAFRGKSLLQVSVSACLMVFVLELFLV